MRLVVAASLLCLAACGKHHEPVDPLTERLAAKCGTDPADVHYAGTTASFGTTERHEWWANDASSDQPEFTLSRTLTDGGWRLSCGGEPSTPVSVSDAELHAAASS